MRNRNRTVVIIILVLVLSALVGAGTALAAYPAQAADSELAPLLQQLLVPGVLGGVVGIILSYVVEFWPAFSSLSGKVKRLVFFAVALVLGVAAGVGIAYFNNAAFVWDSILANAFVAALAAVSGGTLADTRNL